MTSDRIVVAAQETDDALLGSMADAMAGLHDSPTEPIRLRPDATWEEAARHGTATADRWLGRTKWPSRDEVERWR